MTGESRALGAGPPATLVGRHLPAPLRVTAYYASVYRRKWRLSMLATIVGPLLFLLALGVGLGTLVDRHGTAGIGGVSYLQFVAPGLAASTGMQVAATEALFPVFGAIRWTKVYDAMLATSLEVEDVVAGHLLWILGRVTASVAVASAAAACLGGLQSVAGLAMVPAGVLTGTVFATNLMAFSAWQRRDSAFPLLYRLGIVPLFLFSGTFFPVSQLPRWLQVVAWFTPLYHGVALARTASLGTATVPGTLAHVGYLVALSAIGGFLAVRSFRARLTT